MKDPADTLAWNLNAYRKSFENASVRFVLAFPDVYEIGMSHLGTSVALSSVERAEGVMADRVYAPWPDYEEELEKLPGNPERDRKRAAPL